MTRTHNRAREPGDKLRAMSSSERCDRLVQLLDCVVLPQRQRLLQYRDHSWQSAHVDSDGSLGELIAAYVTGVPGRSLKGKSGDSNDLIDGTEVKSSYRLDPNIDFVFEGRLATVPRKTRGRERIIELTGLPKELSREQILHQINANASSVQLLAANDPATHPLGPELGRTASKDAFVAGDPPHLRLTSKADLRHLPDGTAATACVRQERAHINFGDKTRTQLDLMFKSRPPVLVFYTFDRMGRPLFSVVRVGLDARQRKVYLDRVFARSTRARQVQPYLFPDNVRDRLYVSSNHSVADALKGRLLCVVVGTSAGARVLHWEPDDPPRVAERADLLTEVVPRSHGAAFSHSPISLNLDSERGRRRATRDFYSSSVKGWFDAIREYCVETNVTTNIGLGNLAQHLVSLRTGVRGSRSGARGADLVEEDGAVSEVKLATGDPTERTFMDSSDTPRLNLQANKASMERWKRLFPVRIVAMEDGVNVLLHAPTEAAMTEFRRQMRSYFRAHRSSTNLQYHAHAAFSHDRYGPEGRHLQFVRVAWLKPSGRHEFHDVPSW
jgi:hypothetical protein